jgi:hypothetical protein
MRDADLRTMMGEKFTSAVSKEGEEDVENVNP